MNPRTTEDPSQKIQFSLKRISTVRPKNCGGGVGWLSQTRPIPRSPDGDKNRPSCLQYVSDEMNALQVSLDGRHLFRRFIWACR